jgi:hypothetical protein
MTFVGKGLLEVPTVEFDSICIVHLTLVRPLCIICSDSLATQEVKDMGESSVGGAGGRGARWAQMIRDRLRFVGKSRGFPGQFQVRQDTRDALVRSRQARMIALRHQLEQRRVKGRPPHRRLAEGGSETGSRTAMSDAIHRRLQGDVENNLWKEQRKHYRSATDKKKESLAQRKESAFTERDRVDRIWDKIDRRKGRGRRQAPADVKKRYGKWMRLLSNHSELSSALHREGALGLAVFGYEPTRRFLDRPSSSKMDNGEKRPNGLPFQNFQCRADLVC